MRLHILIFPVPRKRCTFSWFYSIYAQYASDSLTIRHCTRLFEHVWHSSMPVLSDYKILSVVGVAKEKEIRI
jgi:hypothetical protein